LHGWDRNAIVLDNRQGQVVVINDHVRLENPTTGPQALYVPDSATQKIINNADRGAYANGKQIGIVDGVPIFNGIDRFRNSSSRKLDGWMFVADAAYWPLVKQLQVAATAGIASGVDNPLCGSYDGFIGLQEEYAGKRVRS